MSVMRDDLIERSGEYATGSVLHIVGGTHVMA